MDKNKDEKYDEIVATLQNLQEEQQRQGRMIRRLRWEVRILLLVGFGGLYFWAQYRAIFLVFEWISLW